MHPDIFTFVFVLKKCQCPVQTLCTNTGDTIHCCCTFTFHVFPEPSMWCAYLQFWYYSHHELQVSYPSVYIHISSYIYVYMYIYDFMYIYIYIYIYACVYICIYMYMCIYVCICVDIYLYIYIYIYVYFRMYVYVLLRACILRDNEDYYVTKFFFFKFRSRI